MAMEFAETTVRAVDDSSLGNLPGRISFIWRIHVLVFAIFLGAGSGGVARYGVGLLAQSVANAAFPYGTLVVNVSGSLILTFLYVLLEGTVAAPEWRALLGIGFCGGYTTFSTFSYETLRLAQDGEWRQAALYIMGSVVLSLVAALAGFRLGSMFLQRG
jgi:fluoride exporter